MFKPGLFQVLFFLLLVSSCVSRKDSSDTPKVTVIAESEVVIAAKAFLASLNDFERQTAFIPFEEAERVNWNFVPMNRKGLTLRVMNNEQRQLAQQILQACLSKEGLRKAEAIRGLEQVLTEIEGRTADNDYRNSKLYYVAIFGEPSETEPWGWRFEGHHLSLNYTFADKTLAVTPFFMGTNPAEIKSGPQKGKRVLAAEEDQGRALVSSLNTEQFEKALISEKAYPEIITRNERKVSLEKYEGLPYSELTAAQQKMLIDLIQLYLNNAKPSVAQRYWQGVQEAGIEKLHFAWAGDIEKDQKHYYRVHSPSLLIEYDNTQNGGNHVHAVCRNPNDDFGDDLLQQHYKAHKH